MWCTNGREEVDGEKPEIRGFSNSPVEGKIVEIYPLFTGLIKISKRWLGMGFLKHQQDGLHLGM